ncbi:MAG: 3-phosphoshikimate 1-carboxyvinyltransferase [Lachnospiraceae bacterium]|nr:3-phosphoshikimate 1-carboxyvinyltransferase [Lachnospiraceae bacterium]MDY5701596.1 3-phosphoshikimate 1-carboxyvinyltransferase [Lachnospiraceae bacterium]
MSKKIQPLKGEISIPGDKSISHRAVMLGSLAKGTTEITHFLQGEDCLSTISCFRKLGIDIENDEKRILIHGKGLHGLTAPREILDCGNSGTTTRLLSGILSGQSFSSTLTGDASIQKRPMKRIIDPLSQMGVSITSLRNNDCAPLTVEGKPLKGIHYHSPIASAQVKSAVLLAGLYAEGPTSVTEPYVSRNHSEIMLSAFGANVSCQDTTATILPEPALEGQKITVPGDISSAAYFIAAGLLVPGSELLLKNVGINPTRDGILQAAKSMGADIQLLNPGKSNGEQTADLLITSTPLKGTEIGGALIPALIDEIPIIAIMAAFAEGTTIIKDAAELKVKESNRIQVMADNLTALGCPVEPTEDGMVIHGGQPLHGAVIDSHKDHRIAMSFAVASLLIEGETRILNKECVQISFPGFYHTLSRLAGRELNL